MPSTWLNWLKAFTPLPGHDSHQGHRVSEILRPGCSALSRSREHQFRQCGAAHLDQATLESGQLAVAKLLLVRFAGGQRVGESKVLQFWWKTDVEPARHAEEEGEVEPGRQQCRLSIRFHFCWAWQTHTQNQNQNQNQKQIQITIWWWDGRLV